MPKERIEWIDTARGLGLMLVFLGHLRPPYLATWIYTCHMPLFFFLSGLVFSMHPLKTFLKKKFLRLVVPYFCLGAVIYAFYACVYAYEHRGVEEFRNMFINLLEQRAFWTIWFLAALFIGDIILWMEMKLCNEKALVALIPSCMVMIGAFIFYRTGGSTLPWCMDVACVAQFFILLGYIFKQNYNRFTLPRKTKVLLAPVLLAINIIVGFLCIRVSGEQLDMSVGNYGNEFLTLISALAGIGFIVILCQLVSNRFFRYLGRNTMVFFGWHSRIIIVACGMAYGALGIFTRESLLSEFLYCLTTLIIILIVLYPTTELLKRSKVGHLFGV